MERESGLATEENSKPVGFADRDAKVRVDNDRSAAEAEEVAAGFEVSRTMILQLAGHGGSSLGFSRSRSREMADG